MNIPVHNRKASVHRKRHAFTLVELLAVVLVIAVLLGIILGIYSAVEDSAKRRKTQALIEGVKMALEDYRAETGHYPATNTLMAYHTIRSRSSKASDPDPLVYKGVLVEQDLHYLAGMELLTNSMCATCANFSNFVNASWVSAFNKRYSQWHDIPYTLDVDERALHQSGDGLGRNDYPIRTLIDAWKNVLFYARADQIIPGESPNAFYLWSAGPIPKGYELVVQKDRAFLQNRKDTRDKLPLPDVIGNAPKEVTQP